MTPEAARLVAELSVMRSDLAGMITSLGALDRSCVVAMEALEAEVPPIDVYRTSRFAERRDEFFQALDRFSQQLTRVRAAGIRLHVDVEGRTLTEVAALVGRSRQFVTRLYRQASQD